MGSVFSGQAVGGVFASATNAIVIACGADQVSSAFVCFMIAVLFLGSALAFFAYVTRSAFFQHYLGESDASKNKTVEAGAAPGVGPEGDVNAKFIPEQNEVEIKVNLPA